MPKKLGDEPVLKAKTPFIHRMCLKMIYTPIALVIGYDEIDVQICVKSS